MDSVNVSDLPQPSNHNMPAGVLGAVGGGIVGFLGGFLVAGLFTASAVTAFAALPVASIPAIFTLLGVVGGYVGKAFNLV